jgi:SAM-dependent methyltransferase
MTVNDLHFSGNRPRFNVMRATAALARAGLYPPDPRRFRYLSCAAILIVTGISSSINCHAVSITRYGDHAAGSPNAVSRQQPRGSRKPKLRKPDVIYYPTPPETVAEMLRLAEIRKGDVLYDLGSGDGRIPIAAAREYGVRAVGIEIDPKLVVKAEENARAAKVTSLVSFRAADMFRTNLSEANVVTLYLSEKLNVLLRPKLLRELRPGSRIVSHDFRMGDWKPEQTVRVPWGKLYRTVYLWRVPNKRLPHKPVASQRNIAP